MGGLGERQNCSCVSGGVVCRHNVWLTDQTVWSVNKVERTQVTTTHQPTPTSPPRLPSSGVEGGGHGPEPGGVPQQQRGHQRLP